MNHDKSSQHRLRGGHDKVNGWQRSLEEKPKLTEDLLLHQASVNAKKIQLVVSN